MINEPRNPSMRRVIGRPDFRRLWLAQLGSEIGDWAARIALTFLIWRASHSALTTAMVVAVSFAPALGPGQWLTVFSQRYPARSVMVLADLARAAMFVLLAANPSVPMAFAVSFATGLLAIPFNSLRSAILPEITGNDQLVAGVKVCQASQDAAVICGYLFGGVLVTTITAPGALLCNALSFLLSAALLLGIRCPAARRSVAAADQVNLRQGCATVLAMPRVLGAAMLSVLALACGVAIESVVVPISAGFTPAPWLPTTLLAGTAAVSLVSTLLIPNRFTGWGLLWASFVLLVVPTSVMLVLFSLGGTRLPLLGVLVSGLLFAAPVPANALAATMLPTHSRAAVFSLVGGLIYLGQGLGTAVAGWALDGFGYLGLSAIMGLTLISGSLVVLRTRLAEGTSRAAVANPPAVLATILD